MKAEEKPARLKEIRGLFESLNISVLIDNPNNLDEIKKIHKIKAILTNFSFNDGEELQKLFSEFQKWARAKERKQHIENCAADMMQFISQKIEEMDLYPFEENGPVQNEISRRIEKLKTDNLWFRVVREKNEDLHIIFGEKKDPNGGHAHFIVDAETGEVRVDPDDQVPDTLVEKVVAVTLKDGSVLNVKDSKIKTTLEFSSATHQPIVEASGNNSSVLPTLYVDKTIGKSGGPNGHFHYFKIKNINQGQNVFNVRWGLRGFDYEWRFEGETFDLLAGQEKDVEFPLSGTKVFNEEVKDLNIFLEYEDIDHNTFFVRRALKQQRVPSGAFYVLVSETYFAPVKLTDDGLKMLNTPWFNGDRIEALFEIPYHGEKKKIVIGISGSLLAVWNMNAADKASHAVVELAHRKIRQMVRNNNLTEEHIFTSFDFPQPTTSGFEAYEQARETVA